MEATLEPVSPELVLVTPGLRSLLVERWHDDEEAVLAPRSEPVQAPQEGGPGRISVPAQFALYAAWQALTGAVFGIGAFAVFVALLLLKPLISG
jgi:hypothetical protein